VPLGGLDGRDLAGVLVGYTVHVRDLALDELAAAHDGPRTAPVVTASR
jgi:hypothetical protein